MTFTTAWRNFKRMQDLTVAASGLIYAAAAIRAIDRAGGEMGAILVWVMGFPAAYLAVSLALPLKIPPVKRWLSRYVWMSYQAGYGQTVASTVVGVVLLLAAGGFVYWQAAVAAEAGRIEANIFAAYASGIGILAAQAVLVRTLERVPEVRALIVES